MTKPRIKTVFREAFEAGRSGQYANVEDAYKAFIDSRVSRPPGRPSSMTEAEKQFILKHYTTMGRKWVKAQLPDVTVNQLDYFAAKHGLKESAEVRRSREPNFDPKPFRDLGRTPQTKPTFIPRSVFDLARGITEESKS